MQRRHADAPAVPVRPLPRTGPRRRIAVRPVLLVALTGTALAVLALAMVLTGGRPQPSAPGLPDAGALTGWGLPGTRLLANLAAVGCVGTLLAGAALGPAGPGPLSVGCARAIRTARLWAVGWAAATALSLVLTVSDIAGLPLSELGWPDLGRAVQAFAPVRGLLVVVGLALVVALVAGIARGTTAARLALAVAVVGLTPTLYTGHSAQAAHHTLATGSLVVHVVAATAWIGGLLGILVHLQGSGAERTRAVERFSTLALVCFCAVTGSGVLAAVTRLGTSAENWTTAYGAVLAVKSFAVIALGAVGWQHRRGTLEALHAGRPRQFWRLATGELVVMGAAMGLAVALSRTAAPSRGGGGTPNGLVDDLLGWWRPDAVAVVAVVLALAAYLRGVRASRDARIDPNVVAGWPLRRTGAAVTATALALIALGAPARPKSAVVLTVGIAQYLAVAVVVPVLVALAAPGVLARLVRSPAAVGGPSRRWAKTASDPVNAFALLVAVTGAVWATPVGAAAMGSAPLHLLVLVSLLSAGTVLSRSVLDVDLPAGRSARDRAIVALALGAFLTGFAAALGSREPLPGTTAAGAGVASVAEVVTDQHRAAALLLAAAICVVVTAAAVLVQHRRDRVTGSGRQANPAAPPPYGAGPPGRGPARSRG